MSESSDTDFAMVFSRFAAGARFGSLPEAVIAATKANLLDTLACAAAGRNAPGASELRELVSDWGGKPETAVWWSASRLPSPNAGWLNSVMAHARDYDDTHDAAILHAGVSVVPAALAAAELADRPVSGAELLTGIAIGLELVCRLGMATRIGLTESGFIYSSLFGYFGATAAASKILGLSAEASANALGIAFSQAAGTHQVTRDGALTKRMQPGLAARAALTSLAMGRLGITGARRVFEGEDGLSRIYLRSQLDSHLLRQGLGERFHMVDLSYKPYPCCRFNHSPIDAALALRASPGFELEGLRAIRLYTNRQAQEVVGLPLEMRRAPANVVQAQFSSPYTVACALVQGQVTLSDFTPEAVQRPEIRKYAAMVEPICDAEFESRSGRSISPARIEAEIGTLRLEAEALVPRGHPALPLTALETRAKLEDCLRFGGLDPARATGLADAIAKLQDMLDARSFAATHLTH